MLQVKPEAAPPLIPFNCVLPKLAIVDFVSDNLFDVGFMIFLFNDYLIVLIIKEGSQKDC